MSSSGGPPAPPAIQIQHPRTPRGGKALKPRRTPMTSGGTVSTMVTPQQPQAHAPIPDFGPSGKPSVPPRTRASSDPAPVSPGPRRTRNRANTTTSVGQRPPRPGLGKKSTESNGKPTRPLNAEEEEEDQSGVKADHKQKQQSSSRGQPKQSSSPPGRRSLSARFSRAMKRSGSSSSSLNRVTPPVSPRGPKTPRSKSGGRISARFAKLLRGASGGSLPVPAPTQATAAFLITRCVRGWLSRKSTRASPEKSRLRRRNHIIREIYVSELSYVKNLETIADIFQAPLVKAAAAGVGPVSPEEAKLLFGSIKVVLGINKLILDELHKVVFSPNTDLHVGAVFAKSAPYLRAYSDYIKGYRKSVALLMKLEKERPALREFLRGRLDHDRVNGLPLDSLLILPVQRIPRYEMLLADLERNTSSSHVDNKNIHAALESIRDTAEYIDQATGKSRALDMMLEIQSRFKNQATELIQPHRRFIREGPLSLEGAKDPAKGWAILFNDLLVLASRVSETAHDRLTHLKSISLGDASLAEGDVGFSPSGAQAEYPIVVQSSGKKVRLYSRSGADRYAWVKDIQRAMAAERARTSTFGAAVAWARPQITGVPPESRTMHSLTQVSSGVLVLFGGRDLAGVPSNYVWVYSPRDQSWTHYGPPNEEGNGVQWPMARASHAAAAVGDSVVVHGGMSAAGKPLADTWLWDNDKKSWARLRPADDGASPSPRSGHSLCTVIGRSVLLFGGCGKAGTALDDVWTFHVARRKWTCVKKKEDASWPKGRAFHSTVLVDKYVYLYGGRLGSGASLGDMWLLDLMSLQWYVVEPSGWAPQPRWGHGMVFASKRLVVFGGATDGGPVNDLLWFDLGFEGPDKASTWNAVHAVGPSAAPRFGHALEVATKTTFLMYGGSTVGSGCAVENAVASDTALILDLAHKPGSTPTPSSSHAHTPSIVSTNSTSSLGSSGARLRPSPGGSLKSLTHSPGGSHKSISSVTSPARMQRGGSVTSLSSTLSSLSTVELKTEVALMDGEKHVLQEARRMSDAGRLGLEKQLKATRSMREKISNRTGKLKKRLRTVEAAVEDLGRERGRLAEERERILCDVEEAIGEVEAARIRAQGSRLEDYQAKEDIRIAAQQLEMLREARMSLQQDVLTLRTKGKLDVTQGDRRLAERHAELRILCEELDAGRRKLRANAEESPDSPAMIQTALGRAKEVEDRLTKELQAWRDGTAGVDTTRPPPVSVEGLAVKVKLAGDVRLFWPGAKIQLKSLLKLVEKDYRMGSVRFAGVNSQDDFSEMMRAQLVTRLENGKGAAGAAAMIVLTALPKKGDSW